MSQGWVKLHRKISDSAVWQDDGLFRTFTLLLFMASHKPRQVVFPNWNEPINLNPGDIVTSRQYIAERLYGVRKWRRKESKVRRNLQILERLGNITTKTTTRFTLITIVKWDTYQNDNQEVDQQPANRRPTDDQPPTNSPPTTDQHLTTDKNYKNGEKGKNDENENIFFGSGEPEEKPKRAGKPKPVWDAIVEVFGMKVVTPTDKTRMGRLFREYTAKGATPDEIRKRAANYRLHWPKITLTVDGVLKQWDVVEKPPTPPPTQSPPRVFDDELTDDEIDAYNARAEQIKKEIDERSTPEERQRRHETQVALIQKQNAERAARGLGPLRVYGPGEEPD